MSYINTSAGVKIYINYAEVTEYLIQGSLSDDSVYSSNIITTRGQIILGGTTDVFDFDRTKYPIGSRIDLWVKLDNGTTSRHPKCPLYVLNSSTNVQDRTLTLEVGCSLAFISDREDQYQNAIRGLFGSILDANDIKSFQIDEYNLSTLSSYLACVGKAIYQDKYGHIQVLKAFGQDGLGATRTGGKFTSFDKYTAISIESIAESSIEPDIDAILVEAEFDIPILKENDEEENNTNRPEPLITSVTYRTVKAPSTSGNIVLGEGPTPLTNQSNPNTGTIDSPSEWDGETIGYNYQVTGEMEAAERDVKEKVTSGRYVEYNGPGNQVSLEQTWEYSSAATWASTAVSNSLNLIIPQVNQGIEEINGLLQKCNQFFDKRDEYPQFLEDDSSNPDWLYYHYKGTAFYNQAQNYWKGLEGFVKAANRISTEYDGIYNLANVNETVYKYGSAGEVISEVSRSYVHPASREGAKSHNIFKSWSVVAGPTGTQTRFDLGYSVTWEETEIVNEGRMPGEDGRPEKFDNDLFGVSEEPLYLTSQTTKTYEYGSDWTTEIEEYIDYDDGTNNYRKESYSSSDSASPAQPDRIEDELTGENADYLDESSIDTGADNAESPSSDEDRGGVSDDPTDYCIEKTEKENHSFVVNIYNDPYRGSSGWFGRPSAYLKKVSMPLSFVPIKPIYNPITETCSLNHLAATLNRYDNYIRRYAYVMAKKITGDNRGFRITEKMRAEVFNYYPFYPIQLSFQSANKGFYTRAASSSWVFDSENCVCSFDCMVTGNTDATYFPDPSTKVVYIKTESAITLTSAYLKLQSTTNKIRITTLPTTGTVTLSGVNVSVGDEIDVSDINSNNLVFTPSSGGTVKIDLVYQSLDSNGDTLSSIENIYPLDTSIIITPENYAADGGEFTANTSNNGFDCDGGNFDDATTNGGPLSMEAGDFDTGSTVSLPQPPLPSQATTANGDSDPENDFGVSVKDGDDIVIAVSTLPSDEGDFNGTLDINVTADFVINSRCLLSAEIVETLEWDYGFFKVALGTDIDFGTFAAGNAFAADFGTITAPQQPALASYVS